MGQLGSDTFSVVWTSISYFITSNVVTNIVELLVVHVQFIFLAFFILVGSLRTEN